MNRRDAIKATLGGVSLMVAGKGLAASLPALRDSPGFVPASMDVEAAVGDLILECDGPTFAGSDREGMAAHYEVAYAMLGAVNAPGFGDGLTPGTLLFSFLHTHNDLIPMEPEEGPDGVKYARWEPTPKARRFRYIFRHRQATFGPGDVGAHGFRSADFRRLFPAGMGRVVLRGYGEWDAVALVDGSRTVLARGVHPPIGEPGMVVGEWVA